MTGLDFDRKPVKGFVQWARASNEAMNSELKRKTFDTRRIFLFFVILTCV